MVSELQPPASDKHVLIEIEDACRIIRIMPIKIPTTISDIKHFRESSEEDSCFAIFAIFLAITTFGI